jgi:hypothetical protein
VPSMFGLITKLREVTLGGIRKSYPTVMEIRERASKKGARQSSVMDALFPDDRVWAASIVADQEIARTEDYCKDKFLSELLQDGIFKSLEVCSAFLSVLLKN